MPKTIPAEDLPSITHLRECFDFDPELGVLSWRERPRHHFPTDHEMKRCNTRYAGKAAGSPDHHGYAIVRVNGRIYKTHRILFALYTAVWPACEIDHINGNTRDNSEKNLRAASRADNARNKAMQVNNTSGTSGVYWNKANGKWIATINVGSVRVYLGCFENKAAAIAHRKDAEVKFGYHKNHGRIKTASPTTVCGAEVLQ